MRWRFKTAKSAEISVCAWSVPKTGRHFSGSCAKRAAHSLDDPRLRRLVEIGMHWQADDIAGQAFACRQAAVCDREIPIGRLLMHRLWIIDRGRNALRLQHGSEAVA